MVPGLKATTGNVHDMTGAYLVRPLALDQIPQAYPRVSMLDIALTMEQWQDYGGAMIQPAGDRSGRRADVSVAGGPGVRGGPREGHTCFQSKAGRGTSTAFPPIG